MTKASLAIAGSEGRGRRSQAGREEVTGEAGGHSLQGLDSSLEISGGLAHLRKYEIMSPYCVEPARVW